MFLRRCERRKGGKVHAYWALVESHRTPRGSRQRVVSYLGELGPSEESGWATLGRTLSGKRRTHPQPSLFDPPVHDDPRDDEPILVRLKDLRLERLRDFGDVWLGWGLWRLLELDELLRAAMPHGREDVAWADVAAILALARFCEPASELHIEHTWYRRTALEDLLGVAPEKVNTDRLYAGLDQLLPHKEAIEKRLKERLGDLFDLRYEILLYDVTSTYFEGDNAGNPLARRGYSRDQRPDRPQVLIGLVVTEDGLPLGYEVFEGNRNDSKTVEQMVAAMEAKYGRAQRIWVMDRGMVSKRNLTLLRQRGAAYIVGTPKAMLRQFAEHLTSAGWQTVQGGIEVKLVPPPPKAAADPEQASEMFLLARSADRKAKEAAMHQRFVERLEAGLNKLKAAADSGRLRDEGIAERRLGRLLQRYWRAGKAFDVAIQKRELRPGRPGLSITWQRRPEWDDWNGRAEGCYALRTNLAGVDPAALWKRYIQLTDAEWAFRIAKDELSIRPVWHQKEERVRAHILVCFIAFVLWKTLAQWMRRSTLGDAPRTLLAEFAKIKSGDVVLAACATAGKPARTIRLRCVTEPDPAQKVLLRRLGLNLPRRLRRLDDLDLKM